MSVPGRALSASAGEPREVGRNGTSRTLARPLGRAISGACFPDTGGGSRRTFDRRFDRGRGELVASGVSTRYLTAEIGREIRHHVATGAHGTSECGPGSTGHKRLSRAAPRLRSVWSMAGWLAFGGVLIALSSFVFGRRDFGRELAGKVFVLTLRWHVGIPEAFTKVRVTNGGASPIFSVGVATFDWGRRGRVWWLRRPDRWWTGDRLVGRTFAIVSPSSQTEIAELPAPTTAERGPELPPVILTFTDGNGRRWIRWPDGRLSRRLLR